MEGAHTGFYGVILTPFSEVRVSKKTHDYLISIDRDWASFQVSESGFGTRTPEVQEKIDRVIKAAETLAEIHWLSGETLTEI